MPPSVTSLISRDAPRVGPALIPLEYRTMMRPLTYLPVIDFIISFISSSRDFHASPSLLKTGPLLLAAPFAFEPLPNFATPATSSPCEANLLTPVATLEPWKASPIPGRADQRDWPAPSQSPSQTQGPAARCYAGHGSASGSGFSRALWYPGAPVSPATPQLPRELAHLDHECAPLARQHGPRQHAGRHLAPSREGRR